MLNVSVAFVCQGVLESLGCEIVRWKSRMWWGCLFEIMFLRVQRDKEILSCVYIFYTQKAKCTNGEDVCPWVIFINDFCDKEALSVISAKPIYCI